MALIGRRPTSSPPWEGKAVAGGSCTERVCRHLIRFADAEKDHRRICDGEGVPHRFDVAGTRQHQAEQNRVGPLTYTVDRTIFELRLGGL